MRPGKIAVLVILSTMLLACQTASVLPDGRILLVAGGTAAIFDPANGTITATGAPAAPRMVHTATVLDDGRVLLAGGTSGEVAEASAELYDPATGSFGVTGDLKEARLLHSATRLDDGRVLVVGGSPGGTEQVDAIGSAEIYEPTSGTWVASSDLIRARAGHTATRLPDGRVAILGGMDDAGVIDQAEIYDPATGNFVEGDSLATGRGFHTATLLGDGRVLIVGGLAGDMNDPSNLLATAELYDPSSGASGPSIQLTAPRFGHTAALLPDGRVLIAGGQAAEGEAVDSAEVIDPSSGTSTSTGSLTVPRSFHTASTLPDGRVLIVGGDLTPEMMTGDGEFDVASSSMEIYDPATGTFE